MKRLTLELQLSDEMYEELSGIAEEIAMIHRWAGITSFEVTDTDSIIKIAAKNLLHKWLKDEVKIERDISALAHPRKGAGDDVFGKGQ